MAVVEYARAHGLKGANSVEFEENAAHPVVAFIPGQESIRRKGGTMRLGSFRTELSPGSLATSLYKEYRPDELVKGGVTERHRHRYEVNPEYHAQLEKAGLVLSGMLPEQNLVEFIELPKTVHPYFIATQAHLEFRSRPEVPHPLFAGLIKAAKKR
jgi:CTP synthase